jgi:hypothetical protein
MLTNRRSGTQGVSSSAVAAALLAAAAAGLVSACGQKGPLYLPDKGGAVVTSPAPQSAPPAAPAPAPPASTPQKKQNGDDDSR